MNTTVVSVPTVHIFCGVPGAGKSTLARALGCEVVSADDYLRGPDGVYRHDPAQVPAAHHACFRRFLALLAEGVTRRSCGLEAPDLAVDNTNTTRWERAPYALAAEAHGYAVVLHFVACGVAVAHARNVHGVPYAAVFDMAWGTEPALPWQTVARHDGEAPVAGAAGAPHPQELPDHEMFEPGDES